VFRKFITCKVRKMIKVPSVWAHSVCMTGKDRGWMIRTASFDNGKRIGFIEMDEWLSDEC
jgi:hypothetical protein